MARNTLLIPACVLVAAQAWAQPESMQSGSMPLPYRAAPAPSTDQPRRSLELSTGAQHLTGGLGDWNDITLRGIYDTHQHVIQGEVSVMRRFRENGAFLGLSDTYSFNQDWYGSIAAGAGDGAFYLPRYRVDGTINRKLLADRNLVASLGAGYYRAPDGHTDRSVSVGAVYYFKAPWVLEGGVRFNRSNPGSVDTHQQFIAATWGREKQDVVTARHMWGGEGYQAISQVTQLVNFDSRETTFSWRHWFRPDTGLVLGAAFYKNPLYRRNGVNVGIFHNF